MDSRSAGMISVIVPVYNAEKYLDRCLNSLTEQSYESLEILLINDGSTDSSAQICENWKQRDSRIRFYSQENQGVSAARNLGLDKASGDYVAFVDADDWITRRMLEKQLNCLKKEQSDIVLCGFCEKTGDDAEKTCRKEEYKENSEYLVNGRNFLNNQNCENIQKSQNIQTTRRQQCITVDVKTYTGDYLLRGHNRCWSVLFQKEAIGHVRFIQGLTIGEDLLFMIDILSQIRRVSILEDQDYCYFINENGAMMAQFRDRYMDQIVCWELAAERMKLLWPEYLPYIRVCLFQAALLVAGKLALASELEPEKEKTYLKRCSEAARESWDALGTDGRKLLSRGYRVKGFVFLHTPKLYLKLYHIWKGIK